MISPGFLKTPGHYQERNNRGFDDGFFFGDFGDPVFYYPSPYYGYYPYSYYPGYYPYGYGYGGFYRRRLSYGCDLVVHRMDDGITRFLIKVQIATK